MTEAEQMLLCNVGHVLADTAAPALRLVAERYAVGNDTRIVLRSIAAGLVNFGAELERLAGDVVRVPRRERTRDIGFEVFDGEHWSRWQSGRRVDERECETMNDKTELQVLTTGMLSAFRKSLQPLKEAGVDIGVYWDDDLRDLCDDIVKEESARGDRGRYDVGAAGNSAGE